MECLYQQGVTKRPPDVIEAVLNDTVTLKRKVHAEQSRDNLH